MGMRVCVYLSLPVADDDCFYSISSIFFSIFAQQITWNMVHINVFFGCLNFHKRIIQIETLGVPFLLVAAAVAAAAAVNVVKFIDFSWSVKIFLIGFPPVFVGIEWLFV